MPAHALRVLIGLLGALALLIAGRIWLDPLSVGAALGLSSPGLLGAATLRADVGGFFAAAGALSLTAALRAQPRLLSAPLLMIALALTGRLVGAIGDGLDAGATRSVVIELAMLVVLAAGRRWLRAPASTSA